MATKKKSESVADKKNRLELINERIKKFKQWFHPEVDETTHLVYLAREWAKLDGLCLSKKELTDAGANSAFPKLIKFCQDELCETAKYCNNRKLSSKSTLQDGCITTIEQASQAADLDAVELLYPYLENVYIVANLVRIMRTSYRALSDPGTLNELSISELRGDLLEVIAAAYADINDELIDVAGRGIDVGLTQVKTTLAAANKKLTGEQEKQLECAAKKLRNTHPDWSVSAIAKELHKDTRFNSLSANSIRQNPFVAKLKKTAKAKGSVNT
jgi:hypothetical protein